jgi:alpha-L-fucosidase
MNRRHFIQSSFALLAVTQINAAPIQEDQELGAKNKSHTGPVKLAQRFGDGRDWWFHKRFGMFIHWGLYSIEGWHEQDQWRRKIPRINYVKLANRWNPINFNPNQWIDYAQSAGMSYLCFTTKHHDGFCLFDTKKTQFNCMNTPFGRDILRELADACHKRNFPLCIYYSIVDWNQKNYPNQGRSHELPVQEGDSPDYAKYIQFVKAQVTELCTNYGKISGFWWDMNVTKFKDTSINDLIRKLQPDAVINDRGFDSGDFGTPERDFTKDNVNILSFEKRTEACQSIGMESWGYRKDEDYYSDCFILSSVSRYLARDANYLLNIGPKPDGSFPMISIEFLKRIGTWYKAVSEAFIDTIPASYLTYNRDILITQKGNNLYIILHAEPKGDVVNLKPLGMLPQTATLLNTDAPITCSIDTVPSEHEKQGKYLRLKKLPVNQFADSVLVVKLVFNRPFI